MLQRHGAAIGVLGAFWAALAGPVLASGARLGIWDWDHHLAFAEVERAAVSSWGELPLWNPYIAGGSVLLQHPLSSVLCPDFLVVLALGVPVGLKVLLALRLALGLAGGYLLGLRLGMTPGGAAVASLVAGGSGAYAAHVAFGHFEWTLAGYFPWIALALVAALERRSLRWAGAAGAGIALLYLGGGIYLVVALAAVLAVLVAVKAAEDRNPRILLLGIVPMLLACLLAAAKLLPSWELFREHPRRAAPMVPLRAGEPERGWLEVPLAVGEVYLSPAFDYAIDPHILNHARFWRAFREGRVTREQGATRNRIVEEVNFHAYAGALALLLAALALTLPARRWRGWLAALVALLIFILSDAFSRAWGFSPWGALARLPVLENLRTPGRLLIAAALPLGVLAGLGASRLEGWRPARGPWLRRVLSVLLPAAVALDLALAGVPILVRAFPYPPLGSVEKRPFATYEEAPGDWDLAAVRAGVGALRGHTNLALSSGVVPLGAPGYRGEAFLQGGGGSAELRAIRPNRVEVEVAPGSEGLLVVNQAYARGWYRADRPAEVRSEGGRLATRVTPSDSLVLLVYRPESLFWGIALSILGLVALGLCLAAPVARPDEWDSEGETAAPASGR